MNCNNCKDAGFKWIGDDKEGRIKVCKCGTLDKSNLHPLSAMILEKLINELHLVADTFNVDYRPNLLIDKNELSRQLDQVKQEIALVTNGVVKINFETLREKKQIEYCGGQCNDGLIMQYINDCFFVEICRCNKLEHRDFHPLTKNTLHEFSNRIFSTIDVDFETHLIISNEELQKQVNQVKGELRGLLGGITIIFNIKNISQEQRNIEKLKKQTTQETGQTNRTGKISRSNKG